MPSIPYATHGRSSLPLALLILFACSRPADGLRKLSDRFGITTMMVNVGAGRSQGALKLLTLSRTRQTRSANATRKSRRPAGTGRRDAPARHRDYQRPQP